MSQPPSDRDHLLAFPRPHAALPPFAIPSELEDPDALYQYLLQQDTGMSLATLQQLIHLLYRELKDFKMLVPTQRARAEAEIAASGQGKLAYLFQVLYRKYHLMQVVETALPCGIGTFDTTLAADGRSKILTPNANAALFQPPVPPDLAMPDVEELRALGVTVPHPPLEYRRLRHPTKALRVQVLATPAFQDWFDANLWLADSLVFLHDEMCLSARTRLFRFALTTRNGQPWNECSDALTGRFINASSLSQPDGQPDQLPVTNIYFDEAHAAYLHASDIAFSGKIVPFR